MAVLIKSADDKKPDIDALSALLTRSDLDASTTRKIDQEIRSIRAGITGEREAAYEIDFHYRDSPRRAVIHDLRIEVDGRVAQIDHLVIARSLDMWVCESKHFAEGVGVNEHGEWVAFWNGRSRGIASPVEQNRRHIAVLNDAFEKGLVKLPKRLGVTLKPHLQSFILVSNGARISRPKGQPVHIDGLDTVVKADQLVTTIEKQREEMSTLTAFGALARIISSEGLEDIGKQLVALHKPSQVDWTARFGLAPAMPPTVERLSATVDRSPAGQSCASCGAIVSAKVAAYCEEHARRFDARILCYDCQRQRPRPEAGA
jgi:hypothetical protein